MTRNIMLLVASITFALQACGQSNNASKEGYSKFELETEKCLDQMFEEKGADFNTLITVFEDCFITGKITNSNDSIETQYEAILSFWERPVAQPTLEIDKEKIIAIRDQLGFTVKDVSQRNQLNCFTKTYANYKSEVDSSSSFFAICSTLEAVKRMPNISNGLIASAIKLSMNQADLKKTLYQKAIVLLFCFEM